MILHGLFLKHCALHMRLTNFDCSLNSLDHNAILNGAAVFARTLANLADLGSDC